MKILKFDAAKGWSYDGTTFRVNERDINGLFDTSFTVRYMHGDYKFELSHSTGSEWDANTKWIYKSAGGAALEISQDRGLTESRAKAYLEAKTRY